MLTCGSGKQTGRFLLTGSDVVTPTCFQYLCLCRWFLGDALMEQEKKSVSPSAPRPSEGPEVCLGPSRVHLKPLLFLVCVILVSNVNRQLYQLASYQLTTTTLSVCQQNIQTAVVKNWHICVFCDHLSPFSNCLLAFQLSVSKGVYAKLRQPAASCSFTVRPGLF